MTLQEAAAAVHVKYGTARSRMKRIADGENVRRGFPEPRERLGAGAYLFDKKTVDRFIKDHGIVDPAY
jgi:hypothetical protein